MDISVSTVKFPPTSGGNSYYVGNREPLLPSPFFKLPVGSITARGWLDHQLRLSANGMVGYLPELSKFCRSDSGWMTFNTRGWEELPYWLKGYSDLGYVLRDECIIREARKWLDAALSSQQPDGYFGPPENKENNDLWPNMIMLFTLQNHYEATGDERALPFMTGYFQYQNNMPQEKLLPGSWQKIRGGDNLESIYWLYNRTGEKWLLDLAKKIFTQTANWTGGIPTTHGVNICMGIRQPGIYYQQSRDEKHLAAVERNYNDITGEYGQQPGGMFGADENFRPGRNDPIQAAETCSIVEFMYTNESLLKITGDSVYADRVENITFNSFPASMAPDLRSLHYLTAPNLVQCDSSPDHVFQNERTMASFSPWIYRCCQHNVAQGWPYYAEHLWLGTAGNGLAAVLYAPCEVKAKVADGTEITISEDTGYPFGDEINFTIWTPRSVRFPLTLRIPHWCEEARIYINDETVDADAEAGSYTLIERIWNNEDRVRLELPMKINLTVWEKMKNSVSVNRGPLTYSLKIGEEWRKYGGTDEWPEYEVFPTTPWNYGLIVDRENPESSFEVSTRSWIAYQPFEPNSAPIEFHGKGKRIPNWTLISKCAGELQQSPVRSDEPVEDIALIPMGCARLRISSFPTIGSGPGACKWVNGSISL